MAVPYPNANYCITAGPSHMEIVFYAPSPRAFFHWLPPRIIVAAGRRTPTIELVQAVIEVERTAGDEGDLLDLYVCCQCSFYVIASHAIPAVMLVKLLEDLVRNKVENPPLDKFGELVALIAPEMILTIIENSLYSLECRNEDSFRVKKRHSKPNSGRTTKYMLAFAYFAPVCCRPTQTIEYFSSVYPVFQMVTSLTEGPSQMLQAFVFEEGKHGLFTRDDFLEAPTSRSASAQTGRRKGQI
ncbi:hypothetical protein EI94DRAFT_1792555 [Lactarius quietus]|nr:hypothetical protein EI94DRAFT_1792555 [Lactarius quietus]